MNKILFYGMRGTGKTTYISMIYYYFGLNMQGNSITDIKFEDQQSKEIVESYIEKIKSVRRGEKEQIEIPPTNSKSKIKLIVTMEGKEYKITFIDNKGEDFENESMSIKSEIKESDQIVFIIDSKKYTEKDERKKINNNIEDVLNLMKDKKITVLLSKYDLIEEDFEDYRENYLDDLEDILNKIDKEKEIIPVYCFKYQDDGIKLERYNLEKSLLAILSRSNENKNNKKYQDFVKEKKKEDKNKEIDFDEEKTKNINNKKKFSLVLILALAVSIGIIGWVFLYNTFTPTVIKDYSKLIKTKNIDLIPKLINEINDYSKSKTLSSDLEKKLNLLVSWEKDLNSISTSYEDYKNGNGNGDALISKINDFESEFGKVKKLDDIKTSVMKYTTDKKTIIELYSEVSDSYDIDLLKSLVDKINNYKGPRDTKFDTMTTIVGLWYKRYKVYSKYVDIYNLWENKDYFNIKYKLEKFISTYNKDNPYIYSAKSMLEFVNELKNNPLVLLDKIEIKFNKGKTHGAVGDWAPDNIIFINHEQINENKITGFDVTIPVDKEYYPNKDNSIEFKSEDKNWKFQTILTNLGTIHFGGKDFLKNIIENNMQYSSVINSKERGKTGTAILKFKLDVPTVEEPAKDTIFE